MVRRLIEIDDETHSVVPIEPTDDMLNAAQDRLCEMRSVTHFDDRLEAEKFKAMCSVCAMIGEHEPDCDTLRFDKPKD